MPNRNQPLAVWFAAPEQVELRPAIAAVPDAGEICLETIASGLSAGTERLALQGHVPAALALDLPTFEGGFGFPLKYGYALVGTVTDVGTDVSGFAPGDRVFALHPHQSVATVPASLVTKLPATIDAVLGVFTANLETAVNIALDTALRFGETVIVYGMGVVGLLVAQVLRLAGARRVFAVDPVTARRELALRCGVDAAWHPDALAAELRDRNDGRLADICIEASGAPAALQSAIDHVMDEGTVVVASWYGRKPVTLDLGSRFHRARIGIKSSQVGRLDPALGARWNERRRINTVIDLLPRLVLAPLVTHRIPFQDAALAYDLLLHNADAAQIVLTYDHRDTENTA